MLPQRLAYSAEPGLLLHDVAGGPVAGTQFAQAWAHLTAAVDRERAARVEHAARRRDYGARHLAPHRPPLARGLGPPPATGRNRRVASTSGSGTGTAASKALV